METAREYSIRPEFEKIWKHRKKIILGTFLIILITLIISFFIPTEYRATVKFKPPDLTNLLASNYLPTMFPGVGIGRSADVELMVERLSSYDAFLFLHHRFDLGKIYSTFKEKNFSSIEDSLKYMKIIWDIYENHVEIKVSKYGLVWINVWHSDPLIAAQLANALLDFADSSIELIAKRRTGVQQVKEHIQRLEKEQQTIFDTLAILRKKFRLYSLAFLSEIASKPITEAMLKFPQFAENYAFMEAMGHRMEKNEHLLNQLKMELQMRERLLESYPSLLVEVARAYPSTNKKRPRRSLLLIFSFIGGILLLSLAALLYENYLEHFASNSKN